jgi:hypothetical protein
MTGAADLHKHLMDISGVLQMSNSSIDKTTTAMPTQIEIRVVSVGEAVLPPAAALSFDSSGSDSRGR